MNQPGTIAELGHVHFVGIGGSGMSGLARLMIDRGVKVSGSDMRDSGRLAALRKQGAVVTIGHAAENLRPDGQIVNTIVDTPVIPDDTADLVEARRLGLPILSRAEALEIILADHRVIGVSGTHGKTTTTSMITVALQTCGADPSFAIGSEVNELGSNAHTGTGDYFVVEADESDGAFLHMDPVAVVVTNLEPEHLDHWGDFSALKLGFAEFLRQVKSTGGFAVVCVDDEESGKLVADAREEGVKVVTYGSDPEADYRIDIVGSVQGGYQFSIINRGLKIGPLELQVPGRHNALNATAAFAICVGLGFPARDVLAGLAKFTGARRRFDFRGKAAGVRVYDDYAHHPTELVATLSAAREFVGDHRLVVAFQSYRYYRTEMFLEEFGEALGLADEVVVMEVFAPGEDPIPGASGQAIAAHVPLPPENVIFEPSWSAVAGRLVERAGVGDLVMTLGAGDISLLGPEILTQLRESEEDSTPQVDEAAK